MKKVLLIEDDMVLREATADFLAEEGFVVFTAIDGMLGIKSAIKNLPDLILCDIEMPNFNGYEVYSILQENTDTRLIPFIFLTARTEKEDVRAGMLKGVDDYITKPFDYDELLETINIRIEKRERLLKATSDSSKILFENTITGVFVITGRRFLYVNKQFTKLLGYNLSDLNTANWLSFISEDDKKRVFSRIKSSLLGIKKIVHTEFQVFTKKRKLIDLKVSAGLTNYKGTSALVGYIIEKEKEDSDLKPLDITDVDLDEIVEFLEKNQDLLSVESVEKLGRLHKKINEEEELRNEEKLSGRELEVLDLFCKGKTKHEIGDELFLSVRTVERHRARLIEKTGTNNTVGLVLYAIKNKLIKFELI